MPVLYSLLSETGIIHKIRWFSRYFSAETLNLPEGGVKAGQMMTFTFTNSTNQSNPGYFKAQTYDGTTIYDGNVSSESISITLTNDLANKINQKQRHLLIYYGNYIKVSGSNLTLTSITIK